MSHPQTERRASLSGASNADTPDVFALVDRMVTKHLGRRELSLAVVARTVGYSPRQLQRVLKAQGYTWRSLVTSRRMDKAARLLSYGQRPKGVAHKVGYRPQHLAEAFVRHTGLTPSEARRAGQLESQLVSRSKSRFHPADLAAECRAVDAWSRLYQEAVGSSRKAKPRTAIADVLSSAVQHRPPPRPVAHPIGRRQQQLKLEFRRIPSGSVGPRARPSRNASRKNMGAEKGSTPDSARPGSTSGRNPGGRTAAT